MAAFRPPLISVCAGWGRGVAGRPCRGREGCLGVGTTHPVHDTAGGHTGRAGRVREGCLLMGRAETSANRMPAGAAARVADLPVVGFS